MFGFISADMSVRINVDQFICLKFNSFCNKYFAGADQSRQNK